MPEVSGRDASTALALPPPRNPGLPGFRNIVRKSGKPDLRWGRVGEGGGSEGMWRRLIATAAIPTPDPSPQGGGELAACAAIAARFIAVSYFAMPAMTPAL